MAGGGSGIRVGVSGGGFQSAPVDPATGAYSLSGLASGSYRVQFTVDPFWNGTVSVRPNLVSEYFDDTTSYSDATPVDLSGGSVGNINAELVMGRSISGKVSLPSGINPDWLRGVSVSANSSSGGSSAFSSVDPATGSYTVTGLAPGSYQVQFTVSQYFDGTTYVSPNLVSEYYDNALDWGSAKPVDVSAADQTSINAWLEVGRSISGTVTLPAGSPPEWMQSVMVSASGSGSGLGFSRSATPNPTTGAYTVTGLASGSYTVAFRVSTGMPGSQTPNVADEFYNNATTQSAAEPVDVSAGDRQNIDASLESGRSISGRVTLPVDAPPDWLKAVSVSAIAPNGSYVGYGASVDPSTGTYSLTRLAPGDYRLRFGASSYFDGSTWIPTDLASEYYNDAHDLATAETIATANSDAMGIDATLDHGASLSGTIDVSAVRGSSSEEGVGITLTDTTGTIIYSAFGDPIPANGLYDFSMTNLTPGTYRLGVTTSTWDAATNSLVPHTSQYIRFGSQASIQLDAGDAIVDQQLTARAADAAIAGNIRTEGFTGIAPGSILGSAFPYERIDGEWVRLPDMARFDSTSIGDTAYSLSVPAGDYTVGFETDHTTLSDAEGIREEWWNAKTSLAAADIVTLGSGETRADINGTIRPAGASPVTPTAPGAFVSVAPARLLDTREGIGAARAAVGANQTVDLQVTGRGGVPASGVAAVVMNVTVTGPSTGGFLTVYPSGTTRPTASNLNFTAGQTIPNLVIVKLGATGKVTLINNSAGTSPAHRRRRRLVRRPAHRPRRVRLRC